MSDPWHPGGAVGAPEPAGPIDGACLVEHQGGGATDADTCDWTDAGGYRLTEDGGLRLAEDDGFRLTEEVVPAIEWAAVIRWALVRDIAAARPIRRYPDPLRATYR